MTGTQLLVVLAVTLAGLAISGAIAWSFLLVLRPTMLLRDGRWKEASAAAERLDRSLWRRLPDVHAGTLYTRALCMHLEGRFEQAAELLSELRRARGLEKPLAILEAANLVMTVSDLSDAEKLLVGASDPAAPAEDLMLLALAQLGTGKKDDAAKTFTRAGSRRGKLAPWPRLNEPMFHYLRALYLIRTGFTVEAAHDLEAAAASPIVTVYVERARALLPPPSNKELDPRSSLAGQVMDE